MDRDRGPSPGMDGCREGKIGQREDGAAVDEAQAVSVVIADRQAGPGSAFARLDQFNADEPGKEILPEKGLYGLQGDFVVHAFSSITADAVLISPDNSYHFCTPFSSR